MSAQLHRIVFSMTGYLLTSGHVLWVRLFWNDGKTAKNKAFLQICRLQTSQFVGDMASQAAYLSVTRCYLTHRNPSAVVSLA